MLAYDHLSKVLVRQRGSLVGRVLDCHAVGRGFSPAGDGHFLSFNLVLKNLMKIKCPW